MLQPGEPEKEGGEEAVMGRGGSRGRDREREFLVSMK